MTEKEDRDTCYPNRTNFRMRMLESFLKSQTLQMIMNSSGKKILIKKLLKNSEMFILFKNVVFHNVDQNRF